jgi:Leucine-rich repeat (LRR) protein
VLQELSLADNALALLPAAALARLSALTRLDLSRNAIPELGADDALPRLGKVFFAENLEKKLKFSLNPDF